MEERAVLGGEHQTEKEDMGEEKEEDLEEVFGSYSFSAGQLAPAKASGVGMPEPGFQSGAMGPPSLSSANGCVTRNFSFPGRLTPFVGQWRSEQHLEEKNKRRRRKGRRRRKNRIMRRRRRPPSLPSISIFCGITEERAALGVEEQTEEKEGKEEEEHQKEEEKEGKEEDKQQEEEATIAPFETTIQQGSDVRGGRSGRKEGRRKERRQEIMRKPHKQKKTGARPNLETGGRTAAL
nr:arginine and glutamate-rich protein 1-like [Anolis sagrei ordinatus]